MLQSVLVTDAALTAYQIVDKGALAERKDLTIRLNDLGDSNRRSFRAVR